MSETTVAESALDRLVALEVAGLVLLPGRGPRLYHRCVGDGFSRDASVTGALVAIDHAATVEFLLPATAVDYLRFELPAIAGCYRVGQVVVGGEEVEDLSRRVMAMHGRRLQDPDSPSEIRLAGWSSAPSFELDVRDLSIGSGKVATAPVRVRVTLRKEHAGAEADQRLNLAVKELSRQLEERDNSMRAALTEAAASLSLAQQSAYQQIQSDIQKMDARIDRLGAEMAQTLASLAAHAENLGQNLDAARGQLDFLTHYELNRSLVRRALRKVKRIIWK